jgi:hypothetical protein
LAFGLAFGFAFELVVFELGEVLFLAGAVFGFGETTAVGFFTTGATLLRSVIER